MRTAGILQSTTAPVRTQTEHSSTSRLVLSPGEAVIIVATAGEKTFRVMRDQLTGRPRPEFVDELVKLLFSVQEDGEPHKWTVKE